MAKRKNIEDLLKNAAPGDMIEIKPPLTMSGLVMLQMADEARHIVRCGNCTYINPSEVWVLPKGETTQVCKYQCMRYPEIVLKNIEDRCGEFKNREST